MYIGVRRLPVLVRICRTRSITRQVVRAAIYAEAMRQLDAVRPRFTTWIAPNPGAQTRAGYFAAQGLPLPVGCGPDGRMVA